MIKNPKYTEFGDDVHKDIIDLIHDMELEKFKHLPDIEIHSIKLTKYFSEYFDKWTYHINFTSYNPSRDKMKLNINFYSSERDPSLDNKIEQYLDNYLIKSNRDKQLEKLGI
jgi:hypothetical protein